MSEISTGTRRELIQAVRGRYQTESTDRTYRILDEFVACRAGRVGGRPGGTDCFTTTDTQLGSC